MIAIAALRSAEQRAVAPAKANAAAASAGILWVALVIELGVALLMIGAPGQFRSPAYEAIRPLLPWYGLAFAAAASLLLFAALGLTARTATGAIVMLASAPLLLLAGGFWRASIITGTVTNLALGLMLALVALETASGRRIVPGRRHVLVVGLIQVATGPLMLLFPERFPSGAYGQLGQVVGLVGFSYTAVGALLLVAETRGHARLSAVLAVAAAVNFLPILQAALETRAWTGLLIYGTHAFSLARTAMERRPTSLTTLCVWIAALVAASDLAQWSPLGPPDQSSRMAVISSLAVFLVVAGIAARASTRRRAAALGAPALALGTALAGAISLGLAPGAEASTGNALLTITLASALTARRSRYPLLLALIFSTLVTVVAVLNLLAYLVDEPTLARAYGIFGLRSHAAIALGALGLAVALRAAGPIVRGRIGDRVLATTGVFFTGLVMLGGYAAAAGSGLLALLETRPEAAAAYTVNSVSVALALVLALLLAVVAAAVLFTRTLTRPLDDLVAVMLRFAGGDLEARVPAAGPEQIAAASRAFNQTADGLAAAQRELRDLNETLDERVRERSRQLATATEGIEEFAHTVSHDLRAPLRALDGFRALLEAELGSDKSETTQRHLARIHDATLRMSGLIDDLLTLSMASRAELHPERVDLGALARDLIDAQRRAGGTALRAAVAERMFVMGDRALLRTMLEHLIANALKFSRSSADPLIEIGYVSAGGVATCFVRDNGVGFDMRYVDRLFRPFTRLHGDATFEGTGIGLATVERIVKRHGGRVSAIGTPGEGATITFTLPAADP